MHGLLREIESVGDFPPRPSQLPRTLHLRELELLTEATQLGRGSEPHARIDTPGLFPEFRGIHHVVKVS